MRRITKICLTFSLLFFPLISRGFNLTVVINEIAWMGTAVSSNDEWIELYNTDENAINIDGWVLKTSDGIPEIKLSGSIPAKGFFLLERTDDNTIPIITADQIYTGALENSGENLGLYDNSGNLIDEIICELGWFGGDNSTKQTMEKNESGWQTSQIYGGTAKAVNSIQEAENNEQKEIISASLAQEEKAEIKSTSVIYPSKVVFNEILPSPKGADLTEEWFELCNLNDFEVDLSGWQIKDSAGSLAIYTFPQGTKIQAKRFLVLKRPETKIVLNNDGDGLNLIQPNGNIIDSISFKKALLGQSYSRFEDNWLWSSSPSPGSENTIPKTESEPTQSLTGEQEQKNQAKFLLEKQTASIGEKIESTNLTRNSVVVFIALVLAIGSAALIFFLKKVLKK